MKRAVVARVLIALACAAGPAAAQDSPQDAAASHEPAGIPPGTIAQFLLGAALGLGIHESGHVIAGAALDAHPGIKGITYGFVPFFAITHDPVSPVREYTISAAGFWTQAATSEWLLTRRPLLEDDHAPIAKGVLAFDILASTVYGFAGLAHVGPPERDTRSMALSLRVNESWVGGAVLAPAIFDAWRYKRPDAVFPRWASRVSKAGLVLLVIRAAR